MGDDRMLLHAQGVNQNLAKLISVLQTRFALACFTGTMNLAAAVTTTVNDANTKVGSIILPIATNAAAGTLMGSAKSLYLSARTPGVSFAFSTASGVAAAGTETFVYVMVNVG